MAEREIVNLIIGGQTFHSGKVFSIYQVYCSTVIYDFGSMKLLSECFSSIVLDLSHSPKRMTCQYQGLGVGDDRSLIFIKSTKMYKIKLATQSYRTISHTSGVSTSIKAHNFARLLRGPLSISVASNSKLNRFPKPRYPELKHKISTVPRGSRAKLCALIDVETPRYI